jgi:hypothetical protein
VLLEIRQELDAKKKLDVEEPQNTFRLLTIFPFRKKVGQYRNISLSLSESSVMHPPMVELAC